MLLGEILGLVEQFENEIARPQLLIGLPDEPALRAGDGGEPAPDALDAVLAWMRGTAETRRVATVRIGRVLGPEAAAMQLATLRRSVPARHGAGLPPGDGA